MKTVSACLLATFLLAAIACSKTASSDLVPSAGELNLVQAALGDARSWHTSTVHVVNGQALRMEEDVVCPFAYHRVGQISNDRPGMPDEIIQKDMYYYHDKDQNRWFSNRASGNDYCSNGPGAGGFPLAATLERLKASTMLKRGDLKTVDGVQCRNWDVLSKNDAGPQWGSLCIDDQTHLPYELRSADLTVQYSKWGEAISIQPPAMP